MVETRNTAVGTVVSQEQMVGLPLDGRQASQLVLLSGAAVTQAGGLIGSQREYPSAVAISVAGGTGNSTIYLVDGAFNNDPVNNIGQPMPFPDALEEFKVETGVRPARYGIYTGATVNAVTKAGTNNLHGNLFEFLRDHRFNAKNAFALVDDGLNRHQMGGTLGGPIKQNRMFFFGALQYARNRQRPSDSQAFVPTQAMLNGDFTQVASAACNNGTALTLPAPFVNNRVNPAQFNPISMRIVGPAAGRHRSVRPHHLRRARQQRRAADRRPPRLAGDAATALFGRYYVANYDRRPGYDGTNLLLSTGTGLGLDNRVQTLSLGDDYVLSQNLVSATRFAYARSRIHRSQGDELPNYTDLGSNVWSAATEPGLRFFNLAVTNGFPTAAFPGRVRVDDLPALAGLRLGQGRAPVVVRRQLDPSGTRRHRAVPGQRHLHVQRHARRRRPARPRRPDARPAEPVPAGRQPDSSTSRSTTYGVYVQDVWRVSDKFTLNAGLRWEPYLVRHRRLRLLQPLRHGLVQCRAAQHRLHRTRRPG